MIEESLHKIQQRMADAMASVGRTGYGVTCCGYKESSCNGCRGSGSPWMHSCRRKSRARGKRKTNALYRS